MSGASKSAAKRARFVFTDTALKRLPSMVKKDTDYYDKELPGFICRVMPPRKGFSAAQRRVFYFRRTVTKDGNKSRPKVRMPNVTHAEVSVAEAREWARAQKRLDRIYLSKAIQLQAKQSKASGLTVEKLVRAHIQHTSEIKGWTKATTDRAYGRVNNYFGPIKHESAELLTLDQCDKWKWWLHENAGNCTGSMCYRMLKNAYNWGAGSGIIPRSTVNPADQRFLHASDKEIVVFTYQQMCKSWFFDEEAFELSYPSKRARSAAISGMRKKGVDYLQKIKELRHCIQLMFLTGARENEIEYLTWRQYQWYDNMITNHRRRVLMYTTKKQKNRVEFVRPLPLLGQAIMDEQRKMYPNAGPDDRVFQTFTHRQTLYYFFTRTLKFPVTSHNMRKTCTTGWSMLRIDKEIKEKLLHHTDTSTMNKHYDKWDYFHEKQEALDLWAKHLVMALEKYDPNVEYDYTNNELKDYIHDHGTIVTVFTPSLSEIGPRKNKRLSAAANR